jgi:hypothetical protein
LHPPSNPSSLPAPISVRAEAWSALFQVQHGMADFAPSPDLAVHAPPGSDDRAPLHLVVALYGIGHSALRGEGGEPLGETLRECLHGPHTPADVASVTLVGSSADQRATLALVGARVAGTLCARLDTQLRVLDGDALLGDDDDGGFVHRRLTFTAPHAGRYTVRALSPGPWLSSGDYSLRLAR